MMPQLEGLIDVNSYEEEMSKSKMGFFSNQKLKNI